MNELSNDLIINNIYRSYHKTLILNNINLTFKRSKCYLLLGSNGSGKSTLIKIILNLVRLDNHTFFTKSVDNFIINYVPEKITLPLNIKVYRFLSILCAIKNETLDKLEELLVYWEMDKAKDKKLKELSKGMLQKILIIQAFLGDCDVLIFDEALNGLDPVMQDKMIRLIKNKKEDKKIIIITSHYPSFYKDVIDERIILHEGSSPTIEKLM